MFHTVDALGGLSLSEIAFLYGATGFGLGVADLVVGQVERLGQTDPDRPARRDAPQAAAAADAGVRRRVRAAPLRPDHAGPVVLGLACDFVSWTPAKGLVTLSMLVSGSVIFFAVFVGFACIQFWTIDANEVANAFTYGGNTITQYPMTVFPREIVTGLTFLVPLAFVNWYPALYILDSPTRSASPSGSTSPHRSRRSCSRSLPGWSGAPASATTPRRGADPCHRR